MAKTIKKVLTWAILFIIVVTAGKAILNYVNPEITDLTPYLTMSKYDLARTLGISLSDNPNMLSKIYEYTDSEITVDGDSENSIGIIYIDGRQSGLHTDNRIYSMYGVKIGDAVISLNDLITFPYDTSFEILGDIAQSAATATFYQNTDSNECLVIVSNNTSGRVVALTYYSNAKKATERLTPADIKK